MDIMSNSKDWVYRTRVIWINAAVALGLLIGFRLSPPVRAEWSARIAVFLVAFLNLMFFAVAPRPNATAAEGGSRRNAYGDLWAVITERPVVAAIFANQLWGGARSLGSALSMFRTSSSDYVKGLPNSGSIKTRLIVMSVLMLSVGVVWLLSASGVWRIRRWAWWLALCLNGLASGVTIFLQVFARNEFLVDIAATSAFVALLLPATRRLFKISGENQLLEQIS